MQATEEPAGEMRSSLFVMDEGSGKWRGANANVPPCARLLMAPFNMGELRFGPLASRWPLNAGGQIGKQMSFFFNE